MPPLLPPYFLEVLISVLLFAYLGSAWNILGGYAGQFSFGHAAFFGIGAYTSTLLFLRLGVTPWLGMVAGGGLAAAFGLAAGYLSFRYGLRGPYFSLVTLAFAEMLRVVAVNTKAVGSSLGLVVPAAGRAVELRLRRQAAVLLRDPRHGAGRAVISRRSSGQLGYALAAHPRERGRGGGGRGRRARDEAARHGAVVVPHRAGRHLLRAVLRLHRSHHHLRARGVDPGAAAGHRGRRRHRAGAAARLVRPHADLGAVARGAPRPRRRRRDGLRARPHPRHLVPAQRPHGLGPSRRRA